MSWSFDDQTEARLRAFLGEHGIAAGALTISPIGDGHSNLTFRIETDGGGVVLRRPPPPPLPQGANDVLREAMFMRIVGAADIPVPEIIAAGQTGEVFDVPFYLMGLVRGPVVTDRLPPELSYDGAARDMADGLISAMAQLHAVPWRETTLADKAKPAGFNTRHLRTFRRMLVDENDTVLPAFAGVIAWLEDNVPEPSAETVIHNDLRLGNVIWRPTAPATLAAILDWELAAVGDPLLDLAYLICSFPRDGETHTPIQDLASALLADSLPDNEVLIAHYFELVGRPPTDISWYQAMVNVKLAALYRYSRLADRDPYFSDPAHEKRFLAEAEYYCLLDEEDIEAMRLAH